MSPTPRLSMTRLNWMLTSSDSLCVFCRLTPKLLPLSFRRTASVYQKAPSTRAKERGERRPSRQTQGQLNPAPKRATLPELLSYAVRSGYLTLTIGVVIDIVHALGNYRIGQSSASLVQEVCQTRSEYSCSLADLVRIARILLRSSMLTDKVCGKNILLAASDAGNTNATIILGATMHLSLGERDSVLAHLRKLADKNNIDALTLLGRMYENNGLAEEAVKLYEAATVQIGAEKPSKSVEPVTPASMTADPDWVPMPHAATLLGELHLNRLGDWQTGEQYFKIAALEGDDPYAYWVLADLEHREQGKYTARWLEYATKAAASGYAPAAFALAQFYYKPIEQLKTEGADEKCLQDRYDMESIPFYHKRSSNKGKAIAIEWLGLAFSAGHLEAGARLAHHYKRNAQYLEWRNILYELDHASKEAKKMFPGAIKYYELELKDFKKNYRSVFNKEGELEAVVKSTEET